ncbi:MAG: hypothetical protein NVSMB57_00260 [Actinomycetota bacterium]
MTQRESWPSQPVGAVSRSPLRKENPVTRLFGTLGFLADASRRRPGGRGVLWFIIMCFTIFGVMLISYPFVTQVWANRIQHDRERQFASAQFHDAYKNKTLSPGDALTRIRIPKLKVSVIVVEGITGNALRAGAGHYPGTSLPGEVGNVAIAGHRTGFGEPFRHLEQMTKGDLVYLDTPLGQYTYRVMGDVDGHKNPWITDQIDWTVTTPTPTPVLTLTTCDPPHTSDNRLIVRAELVDTREIQ